VHEHVNVKVYMDVVVIVDVHVLVDVAVDGFWIITGPSALPGDHYLRIF